MAISQDSLRTELQAAEKRLESLRKRRQQAEAEEKRAMDECQAYRVLLATSGTTSSSVKNEDASDATDVSDSSFGTLSKRGMIRKVLSEAGSQGVTPAGIFKVLKSSGVSRTYVHSTLFKMKESGQAKENNGKYSATAVQ